MKQSHKFIILFTGIFVSLIAATISVSLLFTHKLSGRSPEVDIIVPDDYIGYFWVVTDPRGQEPQVEHDVTKLFIPPSGLCLVKNQAIFQNWHSQRFLDRDGHFLLDGESILSSSQQTGVWCLGTTDEGITTFLRGNHLDYLKYCNPDRNEFWRVRNEVRKKLAASKP